MGDIFSPQPVLLLVAIFARDLRALDWAAEWAERSYGAIALRSDRFAFEETDYYRESMGEGLFKQFLALEPLIDPGRLAELKHASNAAELEYSQQSTTPESRPLNIDPGYITLSKLVLASTKNHAHRIYLREGIFAEITLRYRGGNWEPWEWTYPDYRRADFQAFFAECRAFLAKSLRNL